MSVKTLTELRTVAYMLLFPTNGLAIKQLFVDDLSGDITVHSYNKLYADKIIKAKEIEEIILHIYRVLRIERSLV